MIEVGIVIIAFLIIIAMSTLGSVLLLRILPVNPPAGARIFIAALIGAATATVPLAALSMVDGDGDGFEVAIGMAVIAGIAFLVVGWPTSHFATRRLDRLFHYDPGVFE